MPSSCTQIRPAFLYKYILYIYLETITSGLFNWFFTKNWKVFGYNARFTFCLYKETLELLFVI